MPREGWTEQRTWTRWENDRLREMFPTYKVEEIAFVLIRTQHSVKSRALKIGLRKGTQRPMDAGEREIITRLYPHMRKRRHSTRRPELRLPMAGRWKRCSARRGLR
jgi:hypothetical protein